MQRLMIADGSDVVRKVGKRILSELLDSSVKS